MGAYVLGFYLGKVAGGLLFGLVPLFVAGFLAKNWGLGVFGLIASGLSALISSKATLIVAGAFTVIFIIVGIVKRRGEFAYVESMQYQYETSKASGPMPSAPAPTDKVPAWKKVQMEKEQQETK